MNSKLISESKEIPHAVLEDRERMTKIQKLVDKQRAGYQTKSIIADLAKTGKSARFSEE